MSAAMDVLDHVIASVDPTMSKEHANWHGELCVARAAFVELIEAIKPFADAHITATAYGITMTAADLGALAARHLSFVHFTKAASALARVQVGALPVPMTKAQEAEQASIRG